MVNIVRDEDLIDRKRTARALSHLQRAILAALPDGSSPVPTGTIMRRIGRFDPTRADRAAVSRSLARLESRGLASRFYPQIRPVGGGYLWSLHSGVEFTNGDAPGVRLRKGEA